MAGDADRSLDEVTREFSDKHEGRQVKRPKPPFDLDVDALHGGVVGLELPIPHFVLADGLELRSTYAHLIAPFLLAFKRPERPGVPHPAPWKDLAGAGLDITAEVHLHVGARPTNFDRLNTLWFALSLLRLRTEANLQMPVISNVALDQVADQLNEVHFIPLELSIFRQTTAPSRQPRLVDLEWIASNFGKAAALADEAEFNRAYQTLDRAVWSADPGAAIIVVWAAIETLLRLGDRFITDRVSKALAVLLNEPGPARDRAFTHIRANYSARGGSAHDGALPPREALYEAFQLARRAFIRVIEIGRRPPIDELLAHWKAQAAIS